MTTRTAEELGLGGEDGADVKRAKTETPGEAAGDAAGEVASPAAPAAAAVAAGVVTDGSLVGKMVKIQGTARPDLNGRHCFVDEYDEASKRYKLRTKAGEELSLLVKNLAEVGEDEEEQIVVAPAQYAQQQFGAPAGYAYQQQAFYPGAYAAPTGAAQQFSPYAAQQDKETYGGDNPYTGSLGGGDRYLGEVLWFDTTKKFGFISPSDGSDNTFLHLLDIYSPIAKGQKVTYDLGEDITGRKKAVKVVPFGEVSPPGSRDYTGPMPAPTESLNLAPGQSAAASGPPGASGSEPSAPGHPTPIPPYAAYQTAHMDADELTGTRMRGWCKWFHLDKNFGFIIPEDGGKDIFIHSNDLGTLAIVEGEELEFNGFMRDGRRKASQVNKLPFGTLPPRPGFQGGQRPGGPGGFQGGGYQQQHRQHGGYPPMPGYQQQQYGQQQFQQMQYAPQQYQQMQQHMQYQHMQQQQQPQHRPQY